MSADVRPAVRIETRHVERVVAVACDACRHEVELSTRDEGFTEDLGAFFERHSACRTTIRLP